MKKQIFVAGALAALFVLTTAGASFAGDRRGHHRGPGHWSGKHYAAKPHGGHWQRHSTPRHHRGWWNGRQPVPRHRLQHRAPDHRPRFHAPRHRAGHYPGDRHGWRSGPDSHRRPGHFGQRPPAGHRRGHEPSGAAFGQPSAGRGDGGFDHNRQGFDRSDRSGRGGDDAAIASDDASSRRGGRSAAGRQRQL